MLRTEHSKLYRWPSLLVGVLICSLTLSVATRFWAPPASQVDTVKAVERRSVEPRRQHLNQDEIRWFAPVPTLAFFQPIVFHPRAASTETLPSIHVFDESLYNRPPPPSELIL
jgi:hypothetical protein